MVTPPKDPDAVPNSKNPGDLESQTSAPEPPGDQLPASGVKQETPPGVQAEADSPESVAAETGGESVDPEKPAEPELMDAVPVNTEGVLHQAPHEGQLLEACPACGTLMDVTEYEPFIHVHCPSCGQGLRARKQFNHFKLIELVGQGGMGNVFKAVDCNLNRQLALKILKKEFAKSEEERAKLAEESRITASVTHPNVVKVFSFGEDHGQFYMAMELVEKGSLDDLLTLQKRVPEIQVLEVGIQIAQGLNAALERGLIHRDIKPGNILFSDAHTSKLVDFGLAIVMDEAAAAAGEIWGTPYYIAPEKLDNQPEDYRSDIYSLGGTLFHALAGRPPYEAETASMVALKQLKSQPVSLQAFAPDVSSETAYVINRMLAKNPEERYASYEELIEHLTYARDKLLERIKKPLQPKPRVVLETRETRNFSAIISLTLLAVVLISAGLLYTFRERIFGVNVPAASSFSSADFDEAFQGAVSTAVEGRFDEAREQFSRLASTPGVPQPQLNWALLNQGLASILMGDTAAAAPVFEKVQKSGLFSTDPADLPLANLFVDIARFLAKRDRPVGPSSARLFSGSGPEGFALLCFGMHDWELGDIDGATTILQRFVRARPDPDQPWLTLYQPLAKRYVDDGLLLKSISAKADKAVTPADAKALLTEIDAVRSKLSTGSSANEKLDKIREALEKTAH
ncbi:MAG: hypothetical protein Fur0032_12030 [Terrimicrobiaceae bacterium]